MIKRKLRDIFRYEDVCTSNLLANQVTAVFTGGTSGVDRLVACCRSVVSPPSLELARLERLAGIGGRT